MTLTTQLPANPEDQPGKRRVRVGFIPLTDCGPVVIAARKGYDRKHGIDIVLSREASWAAIRDKSLTGDPEAAYALCGLVYGVQMGMGGPSQDTAVLMPLNRNGRPLPWRSGCTTRGL